VWLRVRQDGVVVGGVVGHAADEVVRSRRREGGCGLWSRGMRASKGHGGNHFGIRQILMPLFSWGFLCKLTAAVGTAPSCIRRRDDVVHSLAGCIV